MRSKTQLAMSPVGHTAGSLRPTAPNKAGNALRDAVGCIFDVGQIQLRVSERLRNHHGDFLPLRADSVSDNASIARSITDGPVPVVANHHSR